MTGWSWRLWEKLLTIFHRRIYGIYPTFITKRTKRSPHVTGWTWKHRDFDRLWPKNLLDTALFFINIASTSLVSGHDVFKLRAAKGMEGGRGREPACLPATTVGVYLESSHPKRIVRGRIESDKARCLGGAVSYFIWALVVKTLFCVLKRPRHLDPASTPKIPLITLRTYSSFLLTYGHHLRSH